MRHNLHLNDKAHYIKDRIEAIVYDLEQDKRPEDKFAPISTSEKCMQLPSEVSIKFVGKHEDIPDMVTGLLDEEFIGVDSEWRPVISRTDISRPALF